MRKSIIRAYTAWWPEEGVETREQCDCQELWTTESMKADGFSEDEIKIVEHLQPGDSHRFHCDGFDVVVCYDGEEYEDTSYRFEREAHHLNWWDASGRGDLYDDRY
jgi:hypothetical protein